MRSMSGQGWCPSEGLSLWQAESPLLSASSRGLPSTCVCVPISSYVDIDHSRRGPLLMTSFQLNHFFNDLSSKHAHLLRFWELGLQHMNFEGM